MSDNAVANLPSIEESAQKLAKRVKLAFADLMTDEQVQAMVETALANFTKKEKDYHGHEVDSELDKMILEEIKGVLQPKIKEAITKKVWEVTCSEEDLAKFVAAAAPHVQKTLFHEVIGNTLQRIQNSNY